MLLNIAIAWLVLDVVAVLIVFQLTGIGTATLTRKIMGLLDQCRIIERFTTRVHNKE
jgi:hypothetical protein